MILDKLLAFRHYLRQQYGLRFANRTELKKWQEKQALRLLKEILPHSPHTRSRFGNLSLTSWKNIPVMDKAEMMAHFDMLNTAGIAKKAAFTIAEKAENSRDFKPMLKGYTVGLSSGTSGNRGLFLVSRAERLRWAGVILAKALGSQLFSKQKIAFFLRANSNLYTSIRSHRLKFQFFDLIDSLESHVAKLNSFQPTLLTAPPSMLRLLANAQKQGQLKIDPAKIFSVAEVLDPLDKNFIEDVFAQPLHQIYQATEGFLGITCSQGTMHLNEDLIHIEKEYLDAAAGKFMPVITDLFRKTQPIIRYRLNDILTESATPCACGSVLTALTQIEGRCDDLFYLRPQDGKSWRILFPDYIRRTIIGASPAVEDYLIRQTAPDEVQLFLPETNNAIEPKKVREALNRLFIKQNCYLPQIHIHNSMPFRNPTEKLRRVQRCFTPDELYAE